MSTARGERTAVILNSLPLWVSALKDLAESSDFVVVGSSNEPDKALRLVAQLRPALFLADIDGDEGAVNLGVIRAARKQSGRLKIVVLSNAAEQTDVAAAFAAGADVFALKSVDPSDLAAGMRQVFDQSIFVAPPVAASQRIARLSADEMPSLTRRELEILRLVGEGHTNTTMASMLWVTEQTIKFHLSNIYRKLRVSNRTEASRWAQLHGLLLPSSDATDDEAVGSAM
jgi:DNA-binding NarL/FixJ family response regulator